MKKFLADITTGKDNQTHDIVRVAMVFITGGLVVDFIVGCGVYIFSYLYLLFHPDVKMGLFPLQDYFTATTTFAVGAAGFLGGGAGALLLKKTTEPDGTQTTVESIKTGPGAAEPTIERTTVTNLNNMPLEP